MLGRPVIGLMLSLAIASPALAIDSAPMPNASPLGRFLKAADSNDFTAMRPLIDGKVSVAGGSSLAPAVFMKKIQPCYLRRVYTRPETTEVISAWMCAEGAAKSRVVLASVKPSPVGVTILLGREDLTDRAAPPRTGSALTSIKP